jgi:hypothetical protein
MAQKNEKKTYTFKLPVSIREKLKEMAEEEFTDSSKMLIKLINDANRKLIKEKK